jgi:hypothetical protein
MERYIYHTNAAIPGKKPCLLPGFGLARDPCRLGEGSIRRRMKDKNGSKQNRIDTIAYHSINIA